MTLGLALPNIPNKAFISARVFHLYREAVSPLPWLPMHIISSGSQGGGDRGWVKEKPERFNLNMNRSSISNIASQLAQAIFDNANATRDLAAIERAKVRQSQTHE